MKYFLTSLLLFVLLSTSVSIAQALKIEGKVFDKQTDESLIGANVMVKGTNLGTITDIAILKYLSPIQNLLLLLSVILVTKQLLKK